MISQLPNHIPSQYTCVVDKAYMCHKFQEKLNIISYSRHVIPNSIYSVPTKENVEMQMNESDITIDIILNIPLIFKGLYEYWIFMISNKLLATNHLPFTNYDDLRSSLHWS